MSKISHSFFGGILEGDLVETASAYCLLIGCAYGCLIASIITHSALLDFVQIICSLASIAVILRAHRRSNGKNGNE